MCMAVYTLSDDEKIELDFVSERIYLRADGSTSITVDVLVENIGISPIGRLRVALPYPLVDIKKTRAPDLRNIGKTFARCQKRQLDRIRLRSEELRNPPDPSNWIYRTLPHAKLSDADGKLKVRRTGQVKGDDALAGAVKRFWSIALPPHGELDEEMWFLLVVNDVTLFDILAPPIEPTHGEPDERLLSKERMWVRLEFELPAEGVNAHSLLARLASPSLEYYQRFSSPEVINEEIKTKITKYDLGSYLVSTDPDLREILKDLDRAKRAVEGQLPHKHLPVAVQDWRIFLYREYGLTVEKIELTPRPCEPRKWGPYYLPIEAYPQKSRLGWAPALLYRLIKRKTRIANCNEYWIGMEHACSASEGYSINLTARSHNDLGLIALLVSIGHIIAHKLGWLH
jgi:hypothetical protein